MQVKHCFVFACLAVLLLSVPLRAEEAAAPAVPLKQNDETPEDLARENALLREKLRLLESTPAISADALGRKNYRQLREIAASVKTQRQTMTDFAGFVTWMTGNLSGYSKYVEAGSMAAGFARFLPIPYAGQASLLSKFVSQGILSLNSASVAISRYLATSRQFVTRAESLDPAKPAEISELARFADRELLRDMNDARQKLAAASEISASSLSFLEALNSYVGSSDAYWNKTKAFLSGKEPDRKEKGFLAESIRNLRDKAGSFNTKLRLFDETARKDEPLVKAVVAYDELVLELAPRTSEVKR
ncbi:MAG TPA: hypothetical protein VF799_12925 [Geobacteraceae bacterium]